MDDLDNSLDDLIDRLKQEAGLSFPAYITEPPPDPNWEIVGLIEENTKKQEKANRRLLIIEIIGAACAVLAAIAAVLQLFL